MKKIKSHNHITDKLTLVNYSGNNSSVSRQQSQQHD